MFPALRRPALCLALGLCGVCPTLAQTTAPGTTASFQARHIATVFPGRMTGTPTEMLAADYIHQQFLKWGYESDTRQFHSRYAYTSREGEKTWQNVTGSMVIAAREGRSAQQIIIMSHLDTWSPLSDSDNDKNLGGLALQGIDDNASGLGVMLELAERLKDVRTHYSLRFIATSGEELGMLGARDILERMSEQEKKNTLLVINLDSLYTGERLYFNSGQTTPVAVRKLTRDRALWLARQHGIAASMNPGLNPALPKGTGCCNDAQVFDKAGIPVLNVEATNWSLGNKDGYQQRAKSRGFPQGTSWHSVQRDNVQHLDKWLPGQIETRSRDAVRVLLPLVKELAKADK
ncbi:aminopeptidase [Enterobacteriaceae bacterium 4M9]|nr:aminopeptidase [Enterobacteriaceae bacterium 4M9]